MPIKIDAATRLWGTSDFTVLAAHVDHEQWAVILAHIADPRKVESLDIWKTLTSKGTLQQINDLFVHIKTFIHEAAKALGIEVKAIVEAFKTKPMFAFLKAIKFSLSLILKPLKAFADLYKDGILKVFAEIHKSSAFQKLHEGALSVDEFLNQYPILKRLAGPAVAGLLIWIFLSGNFTAHPDLDMDLSAVIKATLQGHWSAAELFTSKEGLTSIGLLLSGLLAPWPSPAWLNVHTPINILVAMCYTAFKHLPLKGEVKTNLMHIKSKIKWGSL